MTSSTECWFMSLPGDLDEKEEWYVPGSPGWTLRPADGHSVDGDAAIDDNQPSPLHHRSSRWRRQAICADAVGIARFTGWRADAPQGAGHLDGSAERRGTIDNREVDHD